MADDILSQEEVDALLRGVTGEEDSSDEEVDASAVRDYDIGRQERIVRGRMPTLEILNERFARNLRVALFNFMRRNAEISVGPVRVQKYSEFIRNLVVPTKLYIYIMISTFNLFLILILYFWWWIIYLARTAATMSGLKGVILPLPNSALFSACWKWCLKSMKKHGSRYSHANLSMSVQK